ncbi:Ferredoxin thioredoxin reductase catalytic beta chain [uncultured archaeon]|nr:Ferredoxin thioredoxin reductase catalytic beta chain [uncultured archaeon]
MKTKKAIIDSLGGNAKENGYYLCPDAQLFNDLIDGLAANNTRYGYGSCPCRVASGVKKYDVDIICPCEYRDADVDEFGMCYCGMFVNEKIKKNPSQLGPIPERRPPEIMDAALAAVDTKQSISIKSSVQAKLKKNTPSIVVWRCSVCGYLCARELPPPICPICKAKAERFEEFVLS